MRKRAAARPLVTIVTPTMTQPAFLVQAIASVARQTYPRIEHIVVDGGSDAETLHVLRSYEDRIRWLREPDNGMYDALNKGFRLAEGEILAYLNSDDLLFPWAVEIAVEALERHRDAELAYGDALRVYEGRADPELLLQAPFWRPTSGRTGGLVQPAVFWRRSLFDSVGQFDATIRLSADLDFWLRASVAHSFVQIDEVLAVERAHAGTQTSRLNRRLRDEAALVRRRHRGDHRLRFPKMIAARVAQGAAGRFRLLQFLVAMWTNRSAWRHFRTALRPKVRLVWLVPALLTPRPLAGAGPAQIRMLAGRWVRLDETALAVLVPPLPVEQSL